MTTSPADLAREEADKVMDDLHWCSDRWRKWKTSVEHRDAIAALALAMWERGRDDAAGEKTP